MRIALVSICGHPWGGSEVLWTQTAKLAIQSNHTVLVSVFNWDQQHEQIRELKLLGAEMKYRRLFYPSFGRRLKKKIMNFFLLKNKKSTYHDYLLEFQPSHILFNLAGGDEIATDHNDLMVFIRQIKIPFSVFYHSFSMDNEYPVKVKNNFTELVEKACNNFFTSEMQRNVLSNQIDTVIPNAFIINHPIRKISPTPDTLQKDEISKMCIVGNLVCRWKGQDMVLNILAKEKWKQRKWELHIFGKGEDEQKLKEKVEKAGLTNRVHFHGYINNIQEMFNKNDLILIPSRQDSGPIVLFEAMLAAKPVVGTYMGAMPEYLKTGFNGVLAVATNEASYEEAMQKAWNQKEQWGEWGRNGHCFLRQNYDFFPAQTLLNLIAKTQ
jgi:glycosyltransferase involved in cell wall biosynthesis